MPKRDILKRSHPYYNKKEVLEKAEELERRAKNLHKVEDDFSGDDFYITKAKLYEDAAKHYLNAKKPKKAVFCYNTASKQWDFLTNYLTGGKWGNNIKSDSPLAKKIAQYNKESDKDLKNAERLKKSLKGKWHGLEGKSISGVLGIVGILGSAFFFSNKLTGNVVSNIPSQTSNIFGGLLFFIGIVGCLNYFRNRK